MLVYYHIYVLGRLLSEEVKQPAKCVRMEILARLSVTGSVEVLC